MRARTIAPLPLPPRRPATTEEGAPSREPRSRGGGGGRSTRPSPLRLLEDRRCLVRDRTGGGGWDGPTTDDTCGTDDEEEDNTRKRARRAARVRREGRILRLSTFRPPMAEINSPVLPLSATAMRRAPPPSRARGRGVERRMTAAAAAPEKATTTPDPTAKKKKKAPPMPSQCAVVVPLASPRVRPALLPGGRRSGRNPGAARRAPPSPSSAGPTGG